ncbi:winged helix-turn-helix transcriptional regulator [Thermococcus sp. 18S1]|uniref:helix-turn-helix transcriptional regulator n=1 Tax=Thermococcus sp. 18S1 TaxID=1638210 RepID=UPI00143B01F7|nr:helix-turn-helix domain-containing protein [Thermococcus sp. 18S1]NJE31054.1 winged helix-turn-helix transcriptional regulator [Thermococcus sp. 18S1]
MRSKTVMVLAIVLMILPLVSGQYSVESLSLTVYSDGYVKVVEVIVPENYTVSFSVPLLATNVEGLTVIDENGKPLPYEINGSTLTVYFENATGVRVTYYTPDLTAKNGAIWSLSFSSTVPVKITFPDNAVIVDLTDIPLEINGNSILMPAGNQTVSYVLEYSPTGTEAPPSGTTTEPSNSTVPSNPDSPSQTPSAPDEGSTNWTMVGVLVLLALAAGGGFVYMKRGGEENAIGISREDFERRLKEYELTKDEEKALLYLFDRGGRARQAEVREMLGIPKTTAWRMFQRLEKQGLVRVYKKKRENWVELKL